MSFPKQPAFVHECQGWDDVLVQHPAFAFMRAYEKAFTEDKSMQSQPYTVWHTADIVYTDEVNLTWTGAQAFEKHCEMYSHLLSDWFQEPRFVFISETADGYKAFGSGVLYGNYKVPGEKNQTDLQGRKWEFKVSSPLTPSHNLHTPHLCQVRR